MTDEEFDSEFAKEFGEGEPKALEGGFPNATKEEVSLYLQSLSGEALAAFLNLVGKCSMESKEYQKFLGQWKMMLVMANRTTGLTQAYLTGVAIGYFLAKPESLPGDSSIEGSDVVQ